MAEIFGDFLYCFKLNSLKLNMSVVRCNKTLIFLCIGSPRLFDRVKQMFRNLATLLYTKLIDLNVFSVSTFGSNIDRLKAKHLGKLATRLYAILLIVCFIVLGLYNVSQPQIITKTIDKPSLNTYNNLILDHNDTLQCPCSSMSSMYTHFINIQPIFHQVVSKLYESKILTLVFD